MKKPSLGCYILLGTTICFLIASCSSKQSSTKNANVNQKDAEIKTIENMQSAYKGEKTATAKYAAFSKKAEEDGYHSIALLYSAVSEAEKTHANNHKIVIEDAGSAVPEIIPEFKVKNTKENLYDDINGEAYEAKIMYPDFLKTAENANNQIAILSLTYAMKTERKHNEFFKQASDNINNNTLNKLPVRYFVCPSCGNTYATTAPNHCDFSFTEKSKFIVFQ